MSEKKTVVRVSGMTCAFCEKTIGKAVKKLDGVIRVSVSFPKGQAEIVFNTDKVTEKQIRQCIEEKGYKVNGTGTEGKIHPVSKVAPVFLIVIALYFIVRYTVGFDFFNLIPKIDQTVSLAALFATGLLTSVHCIAMCGGINLSQSVGKSEDRKIGFKKPLLYNLGRVVSYTAIGGIVGGLGSVLFISITVKGIIMLLAALFMILMSLSMLGWLPHWLVPRLPAKWSRETSRAKAGRGPFIVGLLNGILPCGPLQAMQLYALSTGSVLMGALSMFLFSIGTVPLMLGTGVVFSMLKGKFTRGITRVSAVLIMFIAVVMLFNATGFFGWKLFASAGSPVFEAKGGYNDAGTTNTNRMGGYAVATIQDGYQIVEAELGNFGYPAILVQRGIPVKFNLNAEESNINGCNGSIIIPKFDIEKQLVAGDNIIQFTPTEEGVITYTCWMGMINGSIKVVSDLSTVSESDTALPDNTGGQGGISGGCCGDTPPGLDN